MDTLIEAIRENQLILLKKVSLTFKRFIYDKIDFSQQLIGIVGPRGVGKTTLILQYLKESHKRLSNYLYLSADNILLEKGYLYKIAREFYLKYNGRLICVDEIHLYPDWNQELKNIYDSFPDLKIIFSGSSSLSLIKGYYDLSRRGILYELPGLSFREYLKLQKIAHISSYSVTDIMKYHEDISQKIADIDSILHHLQQYLIQGYYPYYVKTKEINLLYQQINNTIDKTIYEDISSYYNLKTPNLITFKQILHFLTTSTPGEINVNKLANSIGKTNDTIASYLEILQNSRLIRFLTSDRTGHALIRNAKKVFLDNCTLVSSLNYFLGKQSNTGNQRELFLLSHLQNSQHIPLYTTQGDLVIEDMTLEIGGKNKSTRQIQSLPKSFLVVDDILIGSAKRIPLYLFGFLY